MPHAALPDEVLVRSRTSRSHLDDRGGAWLVIRLEEGLADGHSLVVSDRHEGAGNVMHHRRRIRTSDLGWLDSLRGHVLVIVHAAPLHEFHALAPHGGVDIAFDLL